MRDKKAQNAKSKTKAGESRPNGITPSNAEKSLISSPAFFLERNRTMVTAKIKNSVQIKDGGWKVIWLDPDGNEHTTQCPFAKSKEQAEQDTLEVANEYLNPKPIRSRKVSMISIMIDEANEY